MNENSVKVHKLQHPNKITFRFKQKHSAWRLMSIMILIKKKKWYRHIEAQSNTLHTEQHSKQFIIPLSRWKDIYVDILRRFHFFPVTTREQTASMIFKHMPLHSGDRFQQHARNHFVGSASHWNDIHYWMLSISGCLLSEVGRSVRMLSGWPFLLSVPGLLPVLWPLPGRWPGGSLRASLSHTKTHTCMTYDSMDAIVLGPVPNKINNSHL